jgi:carbon-monoxide dehydrogenase large subunit
VSILGNRVVRLEDPRFLRGNGLYVENLELEGALSVTFVRSPLAHARVTSVDASAALERPDVQVFTGADVDAHPFGPPPHWHITAGMARPLVARDVARFAGDIVAVVVAGDRASAVDAAELVLVDYDPLPAVLSIEEAAKDEILLFPELGSNVANHGGAEELDDALFEGCEVVVSDVLVSQRLVAAPLEPRSAAAVMGEDGRLTLWATSQTPHMGKMVTAGLLGLEPSDVRVVSPDVGGASARRWSSRRRCSSRGSRAGSGARRAGRRRAPRTCSASRTDGVSGSRSRSAGPATGSCWRIGSRCSATAVRTRRSARTSRT